MPVAADVEEPIEAATAQEPAGDAAAVEPAPAAPKHEGIKACSNTTATQHHRDKRS